MDIIKLNATDSTNSYLKRLSAAGAVNDFTVITAEYQSEGRGQMGTNWESQSSKNLTFSVFKHVDFLDIEHQFYISMAVSLAIASVLRRFHLKQLKIKWPNDILSEHQKVSGILIENIIKNNQLKYAIIGIGLNINQTDFESLPSASSIRNLTGNTMDRDEVLQQILEQLNHYFSMLEARQFSEICDLYESSLFRLNKPSTFKRKSNKLFTGYIKGVTETGKLQVLVEDEQLKEFDMKQISLLY